MCTLTSYAYYIFNGHIEHTHTHTHTHADTHTYTHTHTHTLTGMKALDLMSTHRFTLLPQQLVPRWRRLLSLLAQG